MIAVNIIIESRSQPGNIECSRQCQYILVELYMGEQIDETGERVKDSFDCQQLFFTYETF